jgi:prepilin-type N-terminal cleavage/methylation domain-containing protein
MSTPRSTAGVSDVNVDRQVLRQLPTCSTLFPNSTYSEVMKANELVIAEGVSHESGFSLMELMTVIAITSVITLALTSVIVNSSIQQQKMIGADSQRVLHEEIRSILVRQIGTCGLTGLTTGARTIAVPNTAWPSDATISIPEITSTGQRFAANTQYDRLQITDIRITANLYRSTNQFQYVGVDTDNLNTARTIEGAIQVSLLQQTAGNTPRVLYFPVHLGLSTDRSRIVSCNATTEADNLRQMCGAIGGEWDGQVQKCELPCPEGFQKDDTDGGACVVAQKQESNDDESQFHCDASNFCGANGHFSGSHYL